MARETLFQYKTSVGYRGKDSFNVFKIGLYMLMAYSCMMKSPLTAKLGS